MNIEPIIIVERPTSNIERSTLNFCSPPACLFYKKPEHSDFIIRRSKLDVRCSMFIFLFLSLIDVLIIFLLLCIIPACAAAPGPAEKDSIGEEYVVLLHGMGRSRRSMNKLEKYLQLQGYETVNTGYPSTKETIEQIASTHVADAVRECENNGAEKIHFVTHSLGGIVIRQYLQTNSLPEGSRIVMLSPPNKGSELPDFFKGFFLYRWLNGPAGEQLGTNPESIPNRLKPVEAKIGVITGNKSLNPLYSAIVPGKDDGKVSIERAMLDEMTDFLVVPASHSYIMRKKTVLRQVAYFLKCGTFFPQTGSK